MNSLDLVFGFIVLLWFLVKIRTGKRINQPFVILIYMFVLTIKRIIYYVYSLSTRKARRLRTIVEEGLGDTISTHPYEISLGKNNGKDFIVNIMTHHTLIGATSGGGKSWLLHSILKQLYDKGRMFYDNTEVFIVDLKGHPRDMFQNWNPILSGYATRIANNLEDAISMLQSIEYRLGEETEKKILLIVDEVHILTNDKEGDRLLASIASQLRLNGALILLVQHSQYGIIKTFVRYNIERRICGLVMSRNQAQIILDVRPKEEELPEKVGEYLIREPGKSKLIKTTTSKLNLPEDIARTVKNVLAVKAETLPEMKLLIDVIGDKKLGDKITGIRTIAKEAENIPNAQNFVMVAYRNFTRAKIFEAPTTKGGSYTLAVADVNEAIVKLKDYLPNWMSAPNLMDIDNG